MLGFIRWIFFAEMPSNFCDPYEGDMVTRGCDRLLSEHGHQRGKSHGTLFFCLDDDNRITCRGRRDFSGWWTTRQQFEKLKKRFTFKMLSVWRSE